MGVFPYLAHSYMRHIFDRRIRHAPYPHMRLASRSNNTDSPPPDTDRKASHNEKLAILLPKSVQD